MPDVSFTNLLVVTAVAVLAPLTVGFAPRLRVPAVVLEIIGGIIIIGVVWFVWSHWKGRIKASDDRAIG